MIPGRADNLNPGSIPSALQIRYGNAARSIVPSLSYFVARDIFCTPGKNLNPAGHGAPGLTAAGGVYFPGMKRRYYG